MAIARKRKPGPGRKPAGPIKGKIATFSTRITAETKDALAAEAVASGHSVSQVAEGLLKLGLEAKRGGHDPGDPTRALNYLIRGIAELSWGVADDGRQCRWHNDPSVFEAFRMAVAMLLDRLRPPGKIDASIEGPLVGRSPEHHAEHVFRMLWDSLTAASAESPSDLDLKLNRPGLRPIPAERLAYISRNLYTLTAVRRALNVQMTTPEKGEAR